MLFGTLGINLLGNMLAGKGVAIGANGVIWASKWTNRVHQDC